MPAVYAHRRFGAAVLAACQNGEAKKIIEAHRGLYDTGLQGPDILFYYHPLSKNPVRDAGSAMHDEPAAPFFERAALRVSGTAYGEALLSYLFGFICHFALDSECHSYIEYEIAASGHGHIAIETALEAALMEQDGVDWTRENPAAYLEPSETNARVIARVLPARPAQIRAALAGMKQYNRILMPGSPAKDALLRFVLARTGGSLGQLLIGTLDRADYEASSRTLGRLCEGAVPVALELLDNYCAHVFGGAPLCERFRHTYGPEEAKMALYGPAD